MPYNNTPIAPPTENNYTGETKLPLARVKKIISADEDIGPCSATAAFAITIATEMFIQHMVSQVHGVVKTDKRPRRYIMYRDVSAAVAKHDSLEFASDVVPRTVAYRQYVQRRRVAKDAAAASGGAAGPPPGPQQRTLDGATAAATAAPADADAEGKVLESPRSARGTRFDVVSEEVTGGAMDED